MFNDERRGLANPFIRFFVLLAVLIALIIVCFITFRKNENTSTASASASSSSTVSVSVSQSSSISSDSQLISQGTETEVQSSQSTETVQTDTAEQTYAVTAPQSEDGSGAAGIMQMTDEMLQASAETGFHFNDRAHWYSVSSGLCYYNGWQEIDGNSYHFNANGWMDLGWKRICGQTYYFDDNGVYQPGQDNSKLLAFTFDDGPSQGMDEIIDLCNQTGARVTFFMIGKQVENGGAVIPYILKYRCELGNHSYSHSNMDKLSAEDCGNDFATCSQLVASYSGGLYPTVCRFPYGNINDANVAAQGAATGAPSIFWDVDSFDWESRDTEAIKQVVLENISEGNIILMHDRYEESVEACRQLFPELIAQGYQLVTVSELAAAKGVDMQPGVTYYNFRGFDY